MMRDLLSQGSGITGVPEPLRQLGDYEFDLLKFCYFGWLNSFSLGINFWQAQCLPQDREE